VTSGTPSAAEPLRWGPSGLGNSPAGERSAQRVWGTKWPVIKLNFSSLNFKLTP